MPQELQSALPRALTAEAFLAYQFEQYRVLDTAVGALFEPGRRLTCLSIGGSDSAALLFGAMRGRFSLVADLSKDLESSLWLRTRLLRPALPAEVEIRCLDADLFDDRALAILESPGGAQRFDVCFLHKTLHHLRENHCRFADALPEHPGSDHVCVGTLRPEKVFERLQLFARAVVVSEHFALEEDPDKFGAQGGMLSVDELEAALLAAARLGRVEVFRPMRATLRSQARRKPMLPGELGDRLRLVDYVLFASIDERGR
ncbi:MAG TPA: hypothetical protein DFS52_11940 [Myxococcales bacterium]|nr:hypothetical protein [Myxococcales bacterium]